MFDWPTMIRNWHRFLSPSWQSIHLDYPVALGPRQNPQGGMPHPALETIIEGRRGIYTQQNARILEHIQDLQAIRKRDEESHPLRPGWNNGFLPGLDMAALFTMVAEFKPEQYLEVGSGNSTQVAAAACAQHSPNTHITSIDPFPRADIDQLAQTIIRKPFENVDTQMAAELNAGDILFIDNSHRVLPNSDSTVFFLEWVPLLKPGVIVQVHDIYVPWDYPQFMCERAYSEQYMMAMALLSNPDRFKPLFPAFWISKDPSLSQQLAPLWDHPNTQGVEQHGGSFWFEIGTH